MNTKPAAENTANTALITLTPTETRGLKLVKDGDLFPQAPNRWTHLNAEVTYARTDRFKERPQKVKFLTNSAVDALRDHGLIQSLTTDAEGAATSYGITMAGKIWLLRNK